MPKVTKKENYRIEIEPDLRHHRYLNWEEDYIRKDTEKICSHLEYEVRRHCEDVLRVDTVWDTVSYCEFCGADWTEDGDCNGGCCNKDVEYGDSIGYFNET